MPGSASGGRAELPGKHGFRFFPGFYRNVPDTMRRIPVTGNPNGVFDHLVDASQELFVFDTGQAWLFPRFDQAGFSEGMRSLITAIGLAAKIPPNEIEYFMRKMEVFQTSSDARRVGQWEKVAWWDYVNAQHFSPEYQRVFGTGLTKDLVAAKGTKASTRTIGLMALAFVYASMAQSSPEMRQQSGYGAADRLLDAPTNEAWIDPRVAHLQRLGVRFVTGYRTSKLSITGDRITAAALLDANGHRLRVTAADYVRCNVDLATMEGANEAGRQAANAVLDRSASLAARATIGTLWEPQEYDGVKGVDEQRYRAGQPNALDTLPSAVPA